MFYFCSKSGLEEKNQKGTKNRYQSTSSAGRYSNITMYNFGKNILETIFRHSKVFYRH